VKPEDAAAAGAFEPDLILWDAWLPEQVAAPLAGVETPWYVAAGWAIELFLGEKQRDHEGSSRRSARCGRRTRLTSRRCCRVSGEPAAGGWPRRSPLSTPDILGWSGSKT
jgi:hypothetical protein